MMRRREWLLSAVALGAAACSGNQGPKLAKATAGNLPDKGSWHGVWFSELYGNLHLKLSGNNVSGRWERPHKDRWGEISGTVTGAFRPVAVPSQAPKSRSLPSHHYLEHELVLKIVIDFART